MYINDRIMCIFVRFLGHALDHLRGSTACPWLGKYMSAPDLKMPVPFQTLIYRDLLSSVLRVMSEVFWAPQKTYVSFFIFVMFRISSESLLLYEVEVAGNHSLQMCASQIDMC